MGLHTPKTMNQYRRDVHSVSFEFQRAGGPEECPTEHFRESQPALETEEIEKGQSNRLSKTQSRHSERACSSS